MGRKSKDEDIRREVRKSYAEVARTSGSCCGPSTDVACLKDSTERVGYTEAEMDSVPDGSNMGLGCGNPTGIASLKKGEAVLDLGAGGGFDCFLAAEKVGKTGRVIGVDMTPEMIEKARRNAAKGGYRNVEFRLGEIENLPAADSSVDVVISNCVINLVPDKRRVFEEAFRVLRPGGRVIISDIVLLKKLPQEISESIAAWVSCIAGASMKNDYLRTIRNAGFVDVRVLEETKFPPDASKGESETEENVRAVRLNDKEAQQVAAAIASINVYAVKPRRK